VGKGAIGLAESGDKEGGKQEKRLIPRGKGAIGLAESGDREGESRRKS